MNHYCLYTDGACINNPGPGGWAAVWVKDNEPIGDVINGSDPETTNNRMELMAVIEGLKQSPAENPTPKIQIYTDSKYVMDAFEKGWLANWQKNGWKTASKKPVKNKDLWLALYEQTEKVSISWNWVKGHSGNHFNEMVDNQARFAAEQQ